MMSDPVPFERFQEKVRKLGEANTKIAEQAEELRLQGLKLEKVQKIAEKVPGLQQEVKDAQAAAEESAADFGRKSALVSAGITDSDDQETVIARWKRTGEDGERTDLAKWLGKEAKKDRQVSRILAEVEAANKPNDTDDKSGEDGGNDTDDKSGKPAENKDLPNTNKDTKDPANPNTKLSDEAILGMSLDELKKNEDAIFAD